MLTETFDARGFIGDGDIVLITLDTLRYDVAVSELEAGRLPVLGTHIDHWERRHTPASFTYAAHLAFFAGFLPTPPSPGPHPRRFAIRFSGSESTANTTAVFDAPNIIQGLSAAGYRTIGIGGTGFFDPSSQLGATLCAPFDEFHWSPALGVTAKDSPQRQVELARARLDACGSRPAFVFINIAAMHQPNCTYEDGATEDDVRTHAAALRFVDDALAPLFSALRKRGRAWCIITSDHGTAYGEDGHVGHRLAHPVVWNVPYAEFLLEAHS